MSLSPHPLPCLYPEFPGSPLHQVLMTCLCLTVAQHLAKGTTTLPLVGNDRVWGQTKSKISLKTPSVACKVLCKKSGEGGKAWPRSRFKQGHESLSGYLGKEPREERASKRAARRSACAEGTAAPRCVAARRVRQRRFRTKEEEDTSDKVHKGCGFNSE